MTTDLVGADDMMLQVLWTRHFLEPQGHNVRDDVVHHKKPKCWATGKERQSTQRQHENKACECAALFFEQEETACGMLSNKANDC